MTDWSVTAAIFKPDRLLLKSDVTLYKVFILPDYNSVTRVATRVFTNITV